MFIVTAALNMLHMRAGFLTNHAADLFLPPWLYIVFRGLAGYRGLRNHLYDWLGRLPAFAAGLFVCVLVDTREIRGAALSRSVRSDH